MLSTAIMPSALSRWRPTKAAEVKMVESLSALRLPRFPDWPRILCNTRHQQDSLRLQHSEAPMRASLNYSGSYAASKPDGLIWAGTTEEEAGFDEELTPAGRNKVLGDLLRMAPALSETELIQPACLRPLSQDSIPIVGVVPGWQNLYLATGGGRKRILLSTGMCEGLADLILKGYSTVPV